MKWCGNPVRYDRESTRQLRQSVGLVFQDPEQQIVASTVSEDISYGLCNAHLPEAVIRERVDQVMARFNLTQLADRPVHQLSMGQKKRVALAGVMALTPKLLLL
ncbi:energy-coupling factor ABC transporter ATP-binding protein, partial [Frankia sp. Cpl3]|nr:energy-coupling factor ABC transporter ATP-binding protein [Frankia sp. Cpl3]